MTTSERLRLLRSLARVVLRRNALGEAETLVWVDFDGRDRAYGDCTLGAWMIYFVDGDDTVTGPEAYALSSASVESAPQYKHDCEYCVFLGRSSQLQAIRSPNKPPKFFRCDMYFCRVGTSLPPATLIQRFGDEGREYSSCPVVLAQRERGSSGWGELLQRYEAYTHRLTMQE